MVDTDPETIDEQQVTIRDENGRFVPGVSGNPKGRPHKGYSITETIRDMMEEQPEIKKALGAKIVRLALDGDITAIRTLWQYMDGMPEQKTDITTGGQPLVTFDIHGKLPDHSDNETDKPPAETKAGT